MKAHDVLDMSAKHMRDRASTYDNNHGERSMEKTVAMFNLLGECNMTAEEGWLFMALLKMVRSQQGEFKSDNYEDGAAYFALACEQAAVDRRLKEKPENPPAGVEPAQHDGTLVRIADIEPTQHDETLVRIASYGGVNDEAIQLSNLAREALGWAEYEKDPRGHDTPEEDEHPRKSRTLCPECYRITGHDPNCPNQ